MPPKGTCKQGHTKGRPKQAKVGEAHKWKKGNCYKKTNGEENETGLIESQMFQLWMVWAPCKGLP
jgi:hypothetical protein